MTHSEKGSASPPSSSPRSYTDWSTTANQLFEWPWTSTSVGWPSACFHEMLPEVSCTTNLYAYSPGGRLSTTHQSSRLARRCITIRSPHPLNVPHKYSLLAAPHHWKAVGTRWAGQLRELAAASSADGADAGCIGGDGGGAAGGAAGCTLCRGRDNDEGGGGWPSPPKKLDHVKPHEGGGTSAARIISSGGCPEEDAVDAIAGEAGGCSTASS